MFPTALRDLSASLAAWRLWSLLGWLEIRQRYARSQLGPFWLTISMGVIVGTIGLVYGTLFGQDMENYLPMLGIGLVFWSLLVSIINEGCTAYISSSGYIRQTSTPKLLFMLQVGWRNILIFMHNFLIVIVLLTVFGSKDWATFPLFIPGLMLFILNALWMGQVVGIISARFRDLPQIVASLLQVAFYVTPILFPPGMLDRHRWVLDYNPFAYLLDLVREPLIGHAPSLATWMIGGTMAATGWLLALALTERCLKRIPYWI
ncbi:ABC transporter permease [Nitrosovibrio sp. Nv17]|jgi:lipopolysaccharide transport system permease protein|uniref:ABC transporter permease n=1 Tax=Nitrosovibrio sp. Nv17 TaxID=1855339 RepID=UPI000908CCAD|nr:ABC transporter permease [Nitrosovibrio sp. Nv17]SFW26870.1 lipopolysaccharide transport system permease protein [Nitrosovibrio sp. Nv17]